MPGNPANKDWIRSSKSYMSIEVHKIFEKQMHYGGCECEESAFIQTSFKLAFLSYKSWNFKHYNSAGN